MVSHPFASLKLQELYVQVRGPRPVDIFALHADYTQHELKIAYRALAFRLHPDKCATEALRELHTDLFKRVQNAFEKLSTKSDPPPQTATDPKTKAQHPHPEVDPEPIRCSWTPEDSKRIFRRMEAACQVERAMWERIGKQGDPVHMNKNAPRMTKETAERVQNARKVKQARFTKI